MAITFEQIKAANVAEVSEKNVLAINAEISRLPIDKRNDSSEIFRVIRKFALADSIASGNFSNIYPTTLVDVGLLEPSSKNRAAILHKLRTLPQQYRANIDLITTAIAEELAVINRRKERLLKLVIKKS